jgi:hypothetical protein
MISTVAHGVRVYVEHHTGLAGSIVHAAARCETLRRQQGLAAEGVLDDQ